MEFSVLFMFMFMAIATDAATISRTLTVSKHGRADYRTVQSALDSIDKSQGSSWTVVHIRSGTYVEKVVVDKPYVLLEGDGEQFTTIEFGDGGSVVTSPTFKLEADNFVARNLTFKNTYNHLGSKTNVTQAVAAAITGDKASFYGCGFIGLQDTLNDNVGRHFYMDCYIEGAIDFIWGFAQSIYQNCRIKSNNWQLIGGGGYITAQGRNSSDDPSGFIFKDCYIFGSGPIWLGRNYRPYSRVVFADTYMEKMIVPEGWSASFNPEMRELTTYSEANCRGPGSDMEKRVPWVKRVSVDQVNNFTTTSSFIDSDGWLASQP